MLIIHAVKYRIFKIEYRICKIEFLHLYFHIGVEFALTKLTELTI